MPIGNPQWPELAFWTASIVSTRIALIQVWSRSDRFTLTCAAVAKISPRLVEGGIESASYLFQMSLNLPRDARESLTRGPRSPVLVVVVLGVASLSTHHVHAGFRIAFAAGAERVGESLRDCPHDSALCRIERAAKRGQLRHRKTNRGDRPGHIAPLAA